MSANSGKEIKVTSETTSEDRISELPGDVKDQILSLLTTKGAIDTSLLSRAWKDTWLHLLCLDLGKKFFQGFMDERQEISSYKERRQLFFDYVDKVLARKSNQTQKHGECTLQRLCLYMRFFATDRAQDANNRLDRWLHYAVGCLKVKKLEITCSCYNCYPRMYELPKDIMKAAYSLTSLALTCVKLDQDTIDNIASNCPLLEFLSFHECISRSLLLKLSSFNKLLEVHVNNSRTLLSLRFEINSPSLQTFSFKDNGSRRLGEFCEIDVALCSGLKQLKIVGSRLTDYSLKHHLAHLSNLQDLALEDCKFLIYLKISNHGLKVLSLRNMSELKEVEIDAVNLESFTYSHRASHDHLLPVFTFNDFSSKKTTIFMEYGLKALWNVNTKKFIGQLDQCSQYLNTHATTNYGATKTRNLRQIFRPLYHVKHLTVEIKDFPPHAAFLDDLLWLFPHLETILFRSLVSSPRRMVLMLKLKYKGEFDDQENYRHCWWHRLVEVTIENIEGAEECIAPLKALFEDKRDTKKIIVRVLNKRK